MGIDTTDSFIRLSVAIADRNALPSAFVVFRGFEKYIPLAASMGYEGVELALKSASEINPGKLDQWLRNAGMTVSCISTGQVYADTGFMFTDRDKKRRDTLLSVFREIIDMAASYGKLVNVGRVRGFLDEHDREGSFARFSDTIRELCQYAEKRGVKIILEPVNRYELNFVNSLEQGVDVLRRINLPNLKLMPDVFHMNIEDPGIRTELVRYISYIEYIHLADSNRLAPGRGHMDFQDIFDGLKEAGYSGWCSLEILPEPDPETAARHAAETLLPLVRSYNQ